jgi:hypothetical protein
MSHFSDEELSDMTWDLIFHQGAARAATDEDSIASLAHQIEEATAATEWRREEGGASHDAAVVSHLSDDECHFSDEELSAMSECHFSDEELSAMSWEFYFQKVMMEWRQEEGAPIESLARAETYVTSVTLADMSHLSDDELGAMTYHMTWEEDEAFNAMTWDLNSQESLARAQAHETYMAHLNDEAKAAKANHDAAVTSVNDAKLDGPLMSVNDEYMMTEVEKHDIDERGGRMTKRRMRKRVRRRRRCRKMTRRRAEVRRDVRACCPCYYVPFVIFGKGFGASQRKNNLNHGVGTRTGPAALMQFT